jgi:hypothetical protein
VCVVALGLTSRLALAEESVEPVHVRFEGGAACSDESRFFREVRGRTPRVREAEAAERARTFRVRLAADGRVGTLWIEEGAALSAPRTIEARSCEEVVDALAFIAALSVDPSAHAHAVPVETPPPPPPSPPPAPPWAPPVAPAEASTPLVVATLSEGAEPVSNDSPALPLPPPRPARFFVAVGVGPTANVPDTPSNGLGGRAFLEIGRPAGSRWAPSGRIAFDLPSDHTVSPGAGSSASLTWIRGSVDGCPLRFTLAPSLEVAPCVGVEAGALSGLASQIVQSRKTTQPWVAGVAEGRLRLGFLRVVFAELDAGVTVPFTRQDFVFFLPATTTAYQAPPAYFRGLLALGVRFP